MQTDCWDLTKQTLKHIFLYTLQNCGRIKSSMSSKKNNGEMKIFIDNCIDFCKLILSWSCSHSKISILFVKIRLKTTKENMITYFY